MSAAEQQPETQRTGKNRKVIHATCALHRGPADFANLVVSKRDGTIELDPHVTGSCVLTLAEDAATALRDALTGGWGERTAVGLVLRSMADQDTHRGSYSPVTPSVHAACGVEFVPRRLGLRGDRLALPGWPSDPEQICPDCRNNEHHQVNAPALRDTLGEWLG
jgi:hypothetical protein